ncbi:GAF domain-containing protein [Sporosarcina sp. A2]|uniref:GAF domain-containing protein n=1 Tax=Sporosarcina sp. A2 TaxID=3393449 RepID=UPI003D7AEFD9
MEDHTTYNYQRHIEGIQQAMQCDLVAIALLQSENQNFQVHWQNATGNITKRFQRTVLQSGKGVAGVVYKTGKPILVLESEVYGEKDDLYNYPIISSEQLASFAVLPLFENNRVKGILLAGYRKSKSMSDEKYELLQSLIAPTFDFHFSEELMGE